MFKFLFIFYLFLNSQLHRRQIERYRLMLFHTVDCPRYFYQADYRSKKCRLNFLCLECKTLEREKKFQIIKLDI